MTCMCLCLGVSWMFTGQLMRMVSDIDDEMCAKVNTFARYLTIGLLPQCWAFIIDSWLVAQGVVFPQMFLGLAMAVLNAALNLLFIYGTAPMGGSWNGLGFIGSPIASSSVRWVWLLAMVAMVRHWKLGRAGWPNMRCWSEAVASPRLFEFLKLTGPLIMRALLEDVQLQLVVVFATHLPGDVPLAVHTGLSQIFLMFITSFAGVAIATGALTSRHLGAGLLPAARNVSRVAVTATLPIVLLFMLFFVLLRNEIGHFYSNEPAVWSLTAKVAPLTSIALAAATLFYICAGTLEAQGRQSFVAIAFAVGAWCVGLPLSYIFGFLDAARHRVLHGIFGFWLGTSLGFVVVTGIASLAVWRSDWHHIGAEALRRSAI
eukprot:NODE_7073_length_1612_cov_4.906397.p1 GENE.NODE_7073_length_1612_cov_4.906397~~NODE_7073_length_1612_cov_4.906397.p1  ORF type:complete len:417 (+),score=87.72 NODE_7073_length_1612_cov_4.906397:130-1251(+)